MSNLTPQQVLTLGRTRETVSNDFCSVEAVDGCSKYWQNGSKFLGGSLFKHGM